jgi:two-component system phosphate regulon response regulator PhoB
MTSFDGFSPRLLLIENNEALSEPLLRTFEKEGYLVKWSADSTEAHSLIEQFVPNVIILSWNSVGHSGLELCLKIRSNPTFAETNLIVLSDHHRENDVIRVLTVGADDYLTRPVSEAELIARVWAQLRFLRAKSLFSGGKRTLKRPAPVDVVLKNKDMFDTLKHNGIIMNLVSREVKRHDVTIKLRDAEFRLLAILLKDPKRVFTRSELINDLWEQPDKIDYRTIDVMMGRLRKSLTLPNRTDAIRAVRGLGYGLSIDDPLITKRRNRKPVNSQDSIQVQEL